MKPLGGGLLDDANLAIKYLLQFENVVPDPGVEKIEEIEEIAAIVAGSWELTPEEWQEIERIRSEVGTRFCRRCEYCQPCPQGVRISLVMNLPSMCKRLPAGRLLEDWVAEAVKGVENCVECGECEEKCPYHLPIREIIAENIKFYEAALPKV
jgi:predicted aldo/keto reductase-like oxidoreductase